MAIELLQQIGSPDDLKRLTASQLPRLATEVREMILSVVSANGGHLATNLGAVELSIALHRVFNSPRDRLVWDVGNQCYTHKMLTGRRERLRTLRQAAGLSGFTNRGESVHDHFTAGHAGTALSSAIGLARARDQLGQDWWVVVVVGDGALSAGMSLEALNNLELVPSRVLVVLNDNEFSISRSCGALSRRLARARNRILDSGLFGELGIRYLGPVDGHDVALLEAVLGQIREMERSVLLHVVTQKGRGHPPAERDPAKFHGVPPVDPAAPKSPSHKAPTYTEVFCDELLRLARNDSRILAVTAAMMSGTGLAAFAQEFPQRTFDVGIAEQHAVTFSGGLAAGGCRPVVAIYSTFLQRGFDQVIHDVCLQDLPVVFIVDRAGVAGEDGPTHHGVFDLAYLRPLPGIAIMAPRDGPELRRMLRLAFEHDGPSAIRIPRAEALGGEQREITGPLEMGKAELMVPGEHVALLALGSMVAPSCQAASILAAEGIGARVINARFVKPLDAALIIEAARGVPCLVTVEEHMAHGGFGSAVLELLAEHRCVLPVTVLGLPDEFIEHGNRHAILDRCGLSVEKIVERVRDMVAATRRT